MRADITHCPAGHEYTEENTRWTLSEGRYLCRTCKACNRARKIRAYADCIRCGVRREVNPTRASTGLCWDCYSAEVSKPGGSNRECIDCGGRRSPSKKPGRCADCWEKVRPKRKKWEPSW